ncbi:hypothetical protein LEMLEM_LOCUS27428 [Lemmus lemmus]
MVLTARAVVRCQHQHPGYSILLLHGLTALPRSHGDQPPGTHYCGRSPGWQGGLLPRAGAPLHPLRTLSACDSPASGSEAAAPCIYCHA